MAYAAVVSLKHTIDGISDPSPLYSDPSIKKNLKVARAVAIFYQHVLEKHNDRSSKWLDPLEQQMRDAAHKLEDVLELHESNAATLLQEVRRDFNSIFQRIERDLEEVDRELASFIQKLKEVDAYLKELLRPIQEDNEGDDEYEYVSSDTDYGVEMVGRSTELGKMRAHLLQRMRPDDMCFFSYIGELGTGGSVIGRTVFEEEHQRFDCSAWVTIGTKRQQFKEVAILILKQLQHNQALEEDDEEMILEDLYKALENRRYMVVLDDVRDVRLLHYLRGSFPDQGNGSLVFLTTNQEEISAYYVENLHSFRACTAYLQSVPGNCLISAVFGNATLISRGFIEAEKKISENCGGRRMVLAKTLLFLLKTEKKVEQWRKIAADKNHPIFMVEDELSEMLKIKAEMQSHNWDMDDERENLIVTLISVWTDYSSTVAKLKKKMQPERFFTKLQITSLWGMAGIGKTACARKLFQDESFSSHFDHCVWLSLGPKYQADKILIDILAQIYPSIDMKEDEKSVKDLCIRLSNKRCLIVLDDLWSKEPLLLLKKLFPDIRGKALVTSRLAEILRWGEDEIFYEMQLLDKEDSWNLLRQKVFGDEYCPFELEKLGRRIAENCEGLPLLLLKVGDQILKVEKDSQDWKDAAFGKRSSVFKTAHDDIYKILFPSYKELPQHLKAFFLYLGVYSKSYEISKSKLTSILIAEGFLEPKLYGTKEHFIQEFLVELLGRSVTMAQQWGTNNHVQRCRLHCIFWHFCNTEAEKNKFIHAMDSYADCLLEKMKSQRRLCIRNSVLLGFKDVQDSMASATSARSFLCVSPPHQYPVPITFGSRLLRVIHALPIHLYEFPLEVVKLLHLRYLALTCNGELPPSISKFRKLQHLIVMQYMNIKSPDNSSLLPMEIWDMKELKHLQIMGGCLPNPKCGVGLPKLTTLLDASAQSCKKEVLEMIPNLKKLGIRIELAPDDDGNAFNYLNNISCLSGLESLKCVVVNPQLEGAPPPAPVSMFPPSLRRLSLSGLGYPWEHMSIIGKLSNLEDLKLKSYAFQGPRWDSRGPSFEKLKFLSIEDTDLVHWKLPLCNNLTRLSIKHCYNLQEFPTYLPLACFRKMLIVHCSPLTVTWAEKMRQKLQKIQIEAHEIR